MSYRDIPSRCFESIDEAIRSIAAEQFGIITTAELQTLGLARSQITYRARKGSLSRIHEGVHAISGYPRSWHQDLMAGYAWLGDGAVVSHRSAGRLWKLDGMEQAIVELSSERKRMSKAGVTVHQVSRWRQGELRWRSPFRVTSPERTIIDLASVISIDRLEDALESALRQRLLTVDRLAAQAAERSGKGFSGCKNLKTLIDRRSLADPATESRLETAWERIVRRGGFPDPVRQVTMVLGGEERRPDFVWPGANVAVEVDGWKYHFGRKQWARDARKSNLMQIEGWIVLRFTKEDILDDPNYVLRTISEVLVPRLGRFRAL